MISVKKIKTFPHELIGQEIEIIDSTNKSELGLQGKVVDETKNILTISHEGNVKKLIKKNITFKIKSLNLIIEGMAITKRPEDRIKGK
ncbi:ribonuclease P protein subunit [Candidatus Woesearchaeota archaeon]|jgi:ribonuclease P protein subunit POP4|nr:ribonuclease P protein subunit [Candidatus Woesearchaeota archaeon]